MGYGDTDNPGDITRALEREIERLGNALADMENQRDERVDEVGRLNVALRDMTAERDEARAALEWLPKTADGVPMLKDDVVWKEIAPGIVEQFTVCDSTICYSNREAAEKARQA